MSQSQQIALLGRLFELYAIIQQCVKNGVDKWLLLCSTSSPRFVVENNSWPVEWLYQEKLCRLFTVPMILERYGSHIIGYLIKIVQTIIQVVLVTLLIAIIGPVWLIDIIAQTASQRKFSDFDSDSDSTSDSDATTHIQSSNPKSSLQRVYGYLRQSQTSETEDESMSIQSQRQNCCEATDEHGYDSPIFFEDINESGFTFDRDGFQSLLEAVQRDPKPIVIDRIDRLGRDTLETIYVAATLHYEHEVDIITAKHGHYDFDEINDQLFLVLNAIVAGKSVENRVEAAWDSITSLFSEEKKWFSWFGKVPVGYGPDGDEWIEPTNDSSEVITAVINTLLETENRSKTTDRIRRTVQNESLAPPAPKENKKYVSSLSADKIKSAFEQSGYDPENFDGAQLKRLLTNSTLIGEVRYPRNAPREQQNTVDDPDLQVVTEDQFEGVNEIISETARKYSTNTEENVDMSTLADLGILLTSVELIDTIRPVCETCNRGMVKNGTDSEYPLEDGRIAHKWRCPKYDTEDEDSDGQPKVPKKKEWNKIKQHIDDNYSDYSDVLLLKICPPEE